MNAVNPAETLSWMVELWAGQFGESLSGMTGQPAEVRPSNEAATPQGLCWAQEISGSPGVSLWVTAPDVLWQAIGNRVLEQAGLSGGAAEEQRGTFLEVLTQANSAWCRGAGGRLGRELTLAAGNAVSDFPQQVKWLAVSVRLQDGGELPPFALGWSTAFLEQFNSSGTPALVAAAAAGAGAANGAPPEPASATRTLDLLLEVELPVSVSFGRSQMRLKDLVKLNTGSIVELNRAISEPVEVVVNNCVIARGEVVVVEGNYGVRIKQIISRQERLRSLF